MNPSSSASQLQKATSRVAFFFSPRIHLSWLLVLFLVQSVWAETWRVRVSTVLDGDTVVFEGGERLRLRGIDAPEIRHGSTPGQYYGRESLVMLRDLVKGRDLFLDRTELTSDRYGRLVGAARLADGRVVNVLMVEDGAAFAYPHPSDKDTDLADRILRAQRAAMSRGKGFWPKILSLPRAGAVYFGTHSTKRFHVETCPTGRRIKRKNVVVFASLREAFDAGFAPARDCTPWPTAKAAK